MTQTLSAWTTAPKKERGLPGTSVISVQTTPSGLLKMALVVWPGRSPPPINQIAFFQTTLLGACAGLKGFVGVTCVQLAPSSDHQTSPWRPPSLPHTTSPLSHTPE